jgi:dTDP-4-dehydrorhamnose reductase
MSTVLVFGARGMLGTAVAAELRAAGHDDRASARTDFDAAVDNPAPVLTGTKGIVVNAIGILRNRIDAAEPASVDGAFKVNGCFPQRLARAASAHGWRVIHATTDAVFAGRDAPYDERARHDATDPYGQSKSLGEVDAPHVVNLRCSIVGLEPPPGRSLLSWVLNQRGSARLDGYANQRWNGLTTLHLARLIRAAIETNIALPRTLHLLPADEVTKAELLQDIASAFGRTDLSITPVNAPSATDLRLATIHPDVVAALWAAAGYPAAPTVAAMVDELAAIVPGRPWPPTTS